MSRNRNKKRFYRMALIAANGTEPPTATLEIEDDDHEDVEGFERALGKGADIPLDGLKAIDDQPSDSILFIPITKIDATAREVWGRAAQEVRDHADEIMDYQSSKPLFAAWIDDTYKRSGGKSKGNIRAMHGPIAAGKVTDFQFNDPEKAFDIGTKIVDENEWQKCLEGVYTGFSIGGKYARRWYDNGLTRYTAQPREISLVDAPAIPTATFKLVKEDGTEELRKFAKYAEDDLDKALPTQTPPTKQTVVDTQVLMAPALNTSLQVTQADQQDANLDSAKFAQAANPNAGAIDPQQTAVNAEVPTGASNEGPAVADMTGSGGTQKVELTLEGVQKAVQDIPNLRHIQEGDPVSCSNCLHFRSFDWENPYCRKFDSCVRYDWVCDAWEQQGAHPDQTLIPLAETEPPGRVELNKPTSDGEAAKAATSATPEEDPEEKKLKAVGERVGIARRDGSPKTPPKGYPTDLAQYADPANYAFPCDKPRAVTAVGYYNAGGEKVKAYSPREKAVLGRRIARLAGAATGASYRFDPKSKQIERTDKEKAKMDKAISDMLTQVRSLMSQGTPEALEQASAIMDVAIDTVSTPSAVDPQTTATPTSMPTAAKAGNPASPSSSDDGSSTKTPAPSVPSAATTASAAPASAQKVEVTMTQLPSDPVFNSQPPQPFNIGTGGESYIKSRMPEFVGIMERTEDLNRLNKAFKFVGEDQYAFDDMWNASCYELAQMAGVTSKDFGKLAFGGPITFGAGISGRGESVKQSIELAKAFNASTAPGIYLRRLLALMLPVMNPWRMRVNTSTPTTGSNQAIWRMILGFQSTVLAMAMRSPEAGTSIGSTTGSGVPVDETPASFTAAYQSLKLNNAVTGKSLYTMRGYDDPITVALLETLTGMLRVEEMNNLIGNFAAIAKPTSATTTPSTASGAVPASNYIVRVTSLTGQGWRLTQEIPSYLGSGTYTINGTSQATVGESDPTSATVQTLSGTGRLDVVWPSVAGAAAYNVYVRDDTGNTEHWYATVTAPKVSITSYPSTGNSGAAVPDTTANTLGFEGLSRWSVLSTVYTTTIPQKSSVVVDAAGAALTLVAPNSISQLDSVIQQQYTKWHIAPTLLVMSPGTTNHLTAKVGSATNPPQLIVIQQGPAQGQVVGGLAATGYINRFSPWLSNAPSVIPILAHPYLPDGQINVVCESIPYPNAREGRGWTLETLRPYTYWPIAPLTDAYPFMLVLDELLECNHPSAQGQVYGIDIS